MVQPQRGAHRVGQVLLAQHFEPGLGLDQLGQHGVGTRAWQARVEHFNDHVNVFDALPDRLARQVHVSRKPLNRHKNLYQPDLSKRPIVGHISADGASGTTVLARW